jgi:monofunctional glycosyltransferase
MPRPTKISGQPKPSGKNRKSKTKFWFRPLHWLRLFVLVFFASTVFGVLLFRFVPPPLTPLMAIRYVEALIEPGEAHLNKTWRPLEKISPRLAEAVIASEDQLYTEHWGFDWEAILSAFSLNSQGKRKLGASTITQQTAKNLFLWPERSWTRKALEAYFTLLLEILWSKHRILEVYLNIIETGKGVYGAEAAARKYFGISADQLNRNQAALIAAILPNPRNWSPARPTAYLQRRQSWILRQMNHLGPLPNEFYNQTLAPVERHSKTSSTKAKQGVKEAILSADSLPNESPTTDLDPSEVPPSATPTSEPMPLPGVPESTLDSSPPFPTDSLELNSN